MEEIVSMSIRKAAAAGTFYPSDPERLAQQVDRFLESVPDDSLGGRPMILVEPHAGYVYSGQVAAHGYGLLRHLDVSSVVVISPSHMDRFPFASVFDGDAYETPLGRIDIDEDLCRQIVTSGGPLERSSRGHLQPGLAHKEHALEVQLPFLQRVLGSFRIVPVVMGSQTWEICEALGNALAPLLGRRDVLIVASSDLSHFYPYDVAREKDDRFCRLLETMDPIKLYEAVERRHCEACGAGPVVATLVARKASGRGRCRVLCQANSGDVTGDRDRVVGYASAVVVDVVSEID